MVERLFLSHKCFFLCFCFSLAKNHTSWLCEMRYATRLAKAILGRNENIAERCSLSTSDSWGMNNIVICMMIVVAIRTKNPIHTAFCASFFEWFSLMISVTRNNDA